MALDINSLSRDVDMIVEDYADTSTRFEKKEVTGFLAYDPEIGDVTLSLENHLRRHGWSIRFVDFHRGQDRLAGDALKLAKSMIRSADWFFCIPWTAKATASDWLWMLGYAEATKWRSRIVMIPWVHPFGEKHGADLDREYPYLEYGQDHYLRLYNPKGEVKLLCKL